MSESELRMYFAILFSTPNNKGMHLWEICDNTSYNFGMPARQKDVKGVLDLMVAVGKIRYGSHSVYYPVDQPVVKPPPRTLDSDWVA